VRMDRETFMRVVAPLHPGRDFYYLLWLWIMHDLFMDRTLGSLPGGSR
jgi:hypothetical protein